MVDRCASSWYRYRWHTHIDHNQKMIGEGHACAGVCNNNNLKLRQFLAHLENFSRLGFKYKLNVGIEVQIQTNRLHNQSLYLATPTQDNYGIIVMHMKQLTSAIQFLTTSARS